MEYFLFTTQRTFVHVACANDMALVAVRVMHFLRPSHRQKKGLRVFSMNRLIYTVGIVTHHKNLGLDDLLRCPLTTL